jgi:hypothetical protein
MLNYTTALALCLGLTAVSANASSQEIHGALSEMDDAIVLSDRVHYPQATQMGLEQFAMTYLPFTTVYGDNPQWGVKLGDSAIRSTNLDELRQLRADGQQDMQTFVYLASSFKKRLYAYGVADKAENYMTISEPGTWVGMIDLLTPDPLYTQVGPEDTTVNASSIASLVVSYYNLANAN